MKTKKKICYNCGEQNNNMKKAVVKKTVSDWKKKKGLKTQFPNDIILPLKISTPSEYNLIYKLKLSEKNANKYVYYYAADSKITKNCLKINPASKAYGLFLNKGVTKADKNGIASIKIKCPQSYYVDNNKHYISHIHYFLSDKDNKNWDKKMFTERIICDINKNELKKIIESECAIVINALPYEEYIKKRIPKSISIPYDLVLNNKKISKKQLINYMEEMSVNYPKINKLIKSKKIAIENVPLIIYCYNKSCKASDILIDKLVKYGFTNIKEYSGGIVGWLKL